MAPTPPGYRLWEWFTPLTQAASPLTSPWIDATGFSQVVPGFKFTTGTSTASIEASIDGGVQRGIAVLPVQGGPDRR
jgi:hypothetical protein